MKLTDEMRAAIAEELDISVEQLTIGAEDAFRVGYRMGQQAMRERAAKDCAPAAESVAQQPPPSIAQKMRAVDLAIAALEGEEIVWPDHTILHAAASVARRYAQMLESNHDD